MLNQYYEKDTQMILLLYVSGINNLMIGNFDLINNCGKSEKNGFILQRPKFFLVYLISTTNPARKF
jgi:hypothetical protein